MARVYDLHLNDQEWDSLKTALSNYAQVTSCFEVLDDEFRTSLSLLKRIGVTSISDNKDSYHD